MPLLNRPWACSVNWVTFIFDGLRRLRFTFSSSLPHVANYTRELPISLTRMYENALDGEHLPWLHKDSFAELNIIDSGDWGWRGRGYLQPKSFATYLEIELRLDRDKNRWVTKTLAGLGKGTEVWTHAIPVSENAIKVVVDFYVPKLPTFLHKFYGEQLIATYAKLYDEDVWMMATRQQQLDKRSESKNTEKQTEKDLGNFSDIKQQLNKKKFIEFDMNGMSYRLIEKDKNLMTYATVCPHRLGPIERSRETDQLFCSWHGYRFDVETGKCLTGQACRMFPAPDIVIENQRVTARLK